MANFDLIILVPEISLHQRSGGCFKLPIPSWFIFIQPENVMCPAEKTAQAALLLL